MNYRAGWGIQLAILALANIVAFTAKPTRLTLRCPTYLLPGHRNVLRYRLAGNTASLPGRLTLYPVAADGTVAHKPLVIMTIRLHPGSEQVVYYRATGLPAQSMRYRIRLTAGQCCAEGRSEVKAWDLIGCFIDPVTEEEKRQIDAVRHEVPEGYHPEYDPYVDDESENEPPSYCSGINPATVTKKQITVKIRYWDQPVRSTRRLNITPGVPSDKISLSDWQHIWGQSPTEKKEYDDQGAVLYTLNEIFFTTNPGQHLTVRMMVAKDGAMDNAGNAFDADSSTPQREDTVTKLITIDGQGRVNGQYFNAVPHHALTAYHASPQPPRRPEPTRFQRFYPLYRQHINDILAERAQRETTIYRAGLTEMREKETHLREHEGELLAQLRTQAQQCPDHQLTFDEDALENTVCLPTSDAAARIFTTLLREHLVTPRQILACVGSRPELLSPAWQKLFNDLYHDAKPASDIWKALAILLYRARVDEAVHRQVLEQAATAGDAVILYYLFFTSDRETGLPRLRACKENDVVLAQLAGKASPPGIRAVCAAYAASTGKTALAETIGIEVCALPYVGTKHSDQPEEVNVELDKGNMELARARCGHGRYPGNLATLFYQIRTEKAFRIILERADADRARRFDYCPMPAAWKTQIEYPSAKSECQYAAELINELKYYLKQHPK